jgi:superoxide dismutase, Cu-Zn family
MRFLLIASIAFLASCVAPEKGSQPAKVESVFARLYQVKDGALVPVGQAQIAQFPDGLKLAVDLDNGFLPEKGGPYGMHLHAVGKCELPDFTSAGPHWNPLGKQHGRDNPMGQHAGDLPNVDLYFGRSNSASATIADFTVVQLMDGDGAAMVIHEKADDYKTDPTGSSGKRIICGVFERG